MNGDRRCRGKTWTIKKLPKSACLRKRSEASRGDCMSQGSPPEQSIARLRARMRHSGFSHLQVWERCLAFGSTLDPFAVEAVMDQALIADAMNHACIAHAVWKLEQGWE